MSRGLPARPQDPCEAARPGVAFAGWWLMARLLRDEILGRELSSDACWYILLDLYRTDAGVAMVQITSLSPMIGFPQSTARRWTRQLIDDGMLVKSNDPMDRRRFYVGLSPAARAMMCRYFHELSSRGAPPDLGGGL